MFRDCHTSYFLEDYVIKILTPKFVSEMVNRKQEVRIILFFSLKYYQKVFKI